MVGATAEWRCARRRAPLTHITNRVHSFGNPIASKGSPAMERSFQRKKIANLPRNVLFLSHCRMLTIGTIAHIAASAELQWIPRSPLAQALPRFRIEQVQRIREAHPICRAEVRHQLWLPPIVIERAATDLEAAEVSLSRIVLEVASAKQSSRKAPRFRGPLRPITSSSEVVMMKRTISTRIISMSRAAVMFELLQESIVTSLPNQRQATNILLLERISNKLH